MRRLASRFESATVLAVLGIALWALVQGGTVAPRGTTPPVAGNGDVALYREVARRVGQGEGYYPAIAELHRARHYPLKPFYVVRPPALTWVASAVPATGLVVGAWLLLVAGLLAWGQRLRDHAPAERLAALVLLTITGAPLISGASVMFHELWCGLLLTLALALDERWRWRAQLLVVSLALAVREFAAVFLALLLLRAVLERHWVRSLAIVAAGLAATGLLCVHREMVESVVTGSDQASPGWVGLGGPIAVARALSSFSWLGLLPPGPLAAVAFLPLLGWLKLRREPLLAVSWFLVFGAIISAFARPDNRYWIVVLLPAYAMGFAFVPRLFSDLRRKEDRAACQVRPEPR